MGILLIVKIETHDTPEVEKGLPQVMNDIMDNQLELVTYSKAPLSFLELRLFLSLPSFTSYSGPISLPGYFSLCCFLLDYFAVFFVSLFVDAFAFVIFSIETFKLF